MSLKKYLKHQKEFNRRSFIIGSGAIIGLPFLESLFFSRHVKAQNTNAPLRVLFGLIDNGLFRDNSTNNFIHKDVMSLLEQDGIKDKLNIFYNLKNNYKVVNGHHPSSGTCYATGIENRNQIPNSVYSFDQHALEVTGTSYGPYSYEFLTDSKVISAFRTSYARGRLVGAQSNPITAYEKVLPANSNNTNITNKSDLLKELKKGTLHYFSDDIKRIQSKLSPSDKHVLDSHLTRINSLDRSLSAINQDDIKNTCKNYAKPASKNISYQKRREYFSEIIIAAFTCDSTRSLSIALNDGRNDPQYSVILPEFNKLFDLIKDKTHRNPKTGKGDGSYAKASHHSLTHFGNVASVAKIPEKDVIESTRLIDNYNIKFFTDIAKELDKIQDSNGKTILDNSFISFGGGLGSAKKHEGDKVPNFSFGSAGGRIKTKQRLNMRGKKLSSLQKALLQAMGCSLTAYGNSESNANLRVNKSDVMA